MRQTVLLVGAFALLLIGAGCQSTSAELRFKAVKPVNVADNGESRVVEVRVYQLKDRVAFEEATAEAIWDDPKAVLGGDLLGNVQRGEPVYPSEADARDPNIARAKVENLEKETRYIGVLALMENKDEPDKRHVVVPIKDAESVIFKITGYHIEIES
jgi:type VI secretion system VasD/TssJ family lipoprotein